MRTILLALFITFTSQYLVGQNKLEWQDDYKLVVEDFQAPAPNTGNSQTVQAHVSTEFQIMNFEIIAARNFNKNVSNYFFRTASWIDSGDQTTRLLRYAQLIFDLSEWQARELRKRFRENKKQLLLGKHNEIYSQVAKEFAIIQSDYMKETNYGTIESKQIEWENKVALKLNELADYCKSCKPKKKN